jgi:hypothetical protein
MGSGEPSHYLGLVVPFQHIANINPNLQTSFLLPQSLSASRKKDQRLEQTKRNSDTASPAAVYVACL